MQIEVFIMVDVDGDYVVAKDEADLGQIYQDNIADPITVATRTYKLTLNVPQPKIIDVRGTLPAPVEQPAEMAITAAD